MPKSGCACFRPNGLPSRRLSLFLLSGVCHLCVCVCHAAVGVYLGAMFAMTFICAYHRRINCKRGLGVDQSAQVLCSDSIFHIIRDPLNLA